ncbi:MAG: hypothetical protein ACLFRB_08960 [Thiohalorhabdus sp.]|uniref:hypothetical protein n=1 Tax=Thiohalorhabdus sp. TaxID=3094134 RepID=UPI00397F2CD9
MKLEKVRGVAMAGVMLASLPAVAEAGAFDWLKEINVRAEADRSGFLARIAARFEVEDVRVRAVLSKVERPADAYMVFRLGELSGRSPGYILERYRAHGEQGWGALAKRLGIKPGSREFHALKRGPRLYRRDSREKENVREERHGPGRGPGNAPGRGRGNGPPSR